MSIPQSALIVDDESHVRTYVKGLLVRLGVSQIQEAGNLDEARGLLKSGQPELVTLDLNLAGGNGLDFLREIRAQDEEVYVVIMSGDALATTVRATAEAGADGFIRKDLPPAQILEQLNQLFADEATE